MDAVGQENPHTTTYFDRHTFEVHKTLLNQPTPLEFDIHSPKI